MPHRAALAALAAGLLLAACGGDDDDPVTLTLLTYDSFPESDTGLNAALAEFTEDTGIGVELALGGDAGTLVSRAVLSAGNPEGDVVFGIDNTFLSRAVAGGVFEPYEAAGLDRLDPTLTALVPDHEATPVDFGDVCVNVDLGWFDDNGHRPARHPDRPHRSGLPRPPGRPEPGHQLARHGLPPGHAWPSSARTAGRSTGPTCGPTGSPWSTAGTRRTTSGSPGPAAATARWWSATAPAHPPR